MCSGVIWRGDSVINGVPETLDALRALVRSHFSCLTRHLWRLSTSIISHILKPHGIRHHYVLLSWSTMQEDVTWAAVLAGQEADLCDQQLDQVAQGLPRQIYQPGAQREG